MTQDQSKFAFWIVPVPEMLQRLQTTEEGLSSSESSGRLKKYGANLLKPKKGSSTLRILLPSLRVR